MTPTQPLDIGKLKELEILVGQQPDEAILAFATWDVAGPWWKQRAGKLADAAQSLILMAERVERLTTVLQALCDKYDAIDGQPFVNPPDSIWALARNALSPTTTEDQR